MNVKELFLKTLNYLGIHYIKQSNTTDSEKLDRAMVLYDEQNFINVFPILKELAEKDNPKSQLILGVMYVNGEGVLRSNKKAMYYLKKSAQQQEPLAYFFIGSMYEQGKGVKKDIQRAFSWYKQAADLGLDDAYYQLGQMYEYGVGVQKDLQQAIFWHTKAIDHGITKSQVNLGCIYDEMKEYEKAFYCFCEVAHIDMVAQHSIGYFYYEGKYVPKNKEMAIYWWKQAAEQGYPSSQYNLGVVCLEGKSKFYSNKQAIYWFKKSAEQGFADAQFHLASKYEVTKDYKKAFYWYKKAANQGIADAYNQIGILYWLGNGATQNSNKALDYFKMGSEKGSENACQNYQEFRNHDDLDKWYKQ